MKKIDFTHYWIDGFGWENTIFLQSDFDEVEELGHNKKDGYIFLAINGGVKHILKGVYV